ncbi:MAG: MBL fold metallo-hydrolase, partial [Candidatus Limnocylindrales bacterium]
MDLHVHLTPGLGNAAYLLASGHEAIAVDPPRDAWRLEAAADARGWRITHVVETHVHNDYLSGALELRAALGSELVLPARGRYAFAHRGADDGDILEIDGLRLTARATPGHTPEHLAWEVATDGDTGPTAILTGGSLLVGSAGRTDLLSDDQTEALTRAQFGSLRALAGLPDRVAVLPTHGAGSFCSA